MRNFVHILWGSRESDCDSVLLRNACGWMPLTHLVRELWPLARHPLNHLSQYCYLMFADERIELQKSIRNLLWRDTSCKGRSRVSKTPGSTENPTVALSTTLTGSWCWTVVLLMCSELLWRGAAGWHAGSIASGALVQTLTTAYRLYVVPGFLMG